ncbi:MAG: gephyrin-like molybdotransferase Glp [Terrimesophilobacter sp.]
MARDATGIPSKISTAPISIEEHLSHILANVTPRPPELLPLAQTLGLVLAKEVRARVDVPGFDNSAMDGYALRNADASSATADNPVSLTVVADLPAGSAENPRLGAGEAARIMTGASVPDDADCIVPIEDTDQGTDIVVIFRAPQPAAHIRNVGADARTGDVVLTAGRVLGPRDLAAAAATGIGELRVHPAPRVGVLSTGTELRAPGESLGRGQIHDSNSLLLAALVSDCGGIPLQLGSVPDDEDAFRTILNNHAHEVDAFVTSGGVSVGAYDIVKAVLAPLGVWFGPVRMQPGKPQGFGRFPVAVAGDGDTASDGAAPIVFALPGNPVSVFVSFEAFVRPALLAMAGRSQVSRDTFQAKAAVGWRSPKGRAQYMPAAVERGADGTASVRPSSSGGSGSYLVASLARANALAFVPEDVTEVREGDLLTVTLVS